MLMKLVINLIQIFQVLKNRKRSLSEKGSDAQNSLDELSRQDLKPDSDVVPQLQKMNLSSEKTSSVILS